MSRHRVLVIDDNLELAQTTADYLSHHGFDAAAVAGGAKGIERFAAEPSDAVLTDLRMAQVDGLDVLAGVKGIDPSTPVVIMTAFGGIDSAVEASLHSASHLRVELSIVLSLREQLVTFVATHRRLGRPALTSNRAPLEPRVTEFLRERTPRRWTKNCARPAAN